MIGEGHIFLTLHRTMTTEYTVLQVRNPRDERHKVRRQDDSFKEVMGQAIRAINAYLRPGQALGRDDSAGVKDTFSRPPTDLRGNSAAHALNDAAEL